MNLHLDKKVFVVTGGAKGIGEAITRTLTEEGALVVVADKDETAGEAIAKQFSDRVSFSPVDLNSPEACAGVVKHTLKTFGRIDGLVNNAGRNDGIGLESGSPEKFVSSLTQNAAHYYYMAHYCLAELKKSKGAIVNVASKTALTGQGGTSGYVAAKGAILSLTREWAVELLSHSVRVNAVVPAEVWTPLYESWISTFPDPEEKLKTITSKIPLEQRMTTAQEIADTVVFLLSSRASHITGQWIHTDGGYVHLDRSITK